MQNGIELVMAGGNRAFLNLRKLAPAPHLGRQSGVEGGAEGSHGKLHYWLFIQVFGPAEHKVEVA